MMTIGEMVQSIQRGIPEFNPMEGSLYEVHQKYPHFPSKVKLENRPESLSDVFFALRSFTLRMIKEGNSARVTDAMRWLEEMLEHHPDLTYTTACTFIDRTSRDDPAWPQFIAAFGPRLRALLTKAEEEDAPEDDAIAQLHAAIPEYQHSPDYLMSDAYLSYMVFGVLLRCFLPSVIRDNNLPLAKRILDFLELMLVHPSPFVRDTLIPDCLEHVVNTQPEYATILRFAGPKTREWIEYMNRSD